jgi:hypothetical protein
MARTNLTVAPVISIVDPQPGGRSRSGLCQLKIALKGSKPGIWRRVLVRGNMRLDRLHHVIQIAMGWTNSHLHQFITGTRADCMYYGEPEPDVPPMFRKVLNEKRYVLADLAPVAKQKLIYEYDFGDGWEHEIVVEKILPPEPTFKHPICLAGANACPPEDCGGVYGYYNLLKILADPKHPDHDDMVDWIGGEWDATWFDLEAANLMLKRLKA